MLVVVAGAKSPWTRGGASVEHLGTARGRFPRLFLGSLPGLRGRFHQIPTSARMRFGLSLRICAGTGRFGARSRPGGGSDGNGHLRGRVRPIPSPRFRGSGGNGFGWQPVPARCRTGLHRIRSARRIRPIHLTPAALVRQMTDAARNRADQFRICQVGTAPASAPAVRGTSLPRRGLGTSSAFIRATSCGPTGIRTRGSPSR